MVFKPSLEQNMDMSHKNGDDLDSCMSNGQFGPI